MRWPFTDTRTGELIGYSPWYGESTYGAIAPVDRKVRYQRPWIEPEHGHFLIDGAAEPDPFRVSARFLLRQVRSADPHSNPAPVMTQSIVPFFFDQQFWAHWLHADDVL